MFKQRDRMGVNEKKMKKKKNKKKKVKKKTCNDELTNFFSRIKLTNELNSIFRV